MAEDFGFSRLPRGAQILWERVGFSRTLSLGFFFATGARFDPPGKAGVAHLTEHLVFKGTRNHSAVSLARLVDRIGGDLNAWTDREEIAFVCTVPADHWKVAVEALTELCLFPSFPLQDFEREKEVVRNEILATQDDPEEQAYECLLAGLDSGPWSQPVAGTEESLAAIELEDVRSWWQRCLSTDRMTVSVAGDFTPEVLVDHLCRSLETLPPGPSAWPSTPAVFMPSPRIWRVKAPFQMVQVLGGFHYPAPSSVRDAELWQVISMLWGETMSSRLFQALREQRGLCYSVTSQIFDSENVWGLQFFASCAPENTEELVQVLGSEVRRLVELPSGEEWEDARMALRGGLVLAAERMEHRVARLWQQYERFGFLGGVEETLAVLDAPIRVSEQEGVIALLTAQTPSLLLWGKLPRKFPLPPPWND